MKRSTWKRILLLFMLLASLSSVAAAPATNELVGTIHVRHGDLISANPRGLVEGHVTVYLLTDSNGQTHRLSLTADQAVGLSEGTEVTIRLPSGIDENNPLPVEQITQSQRPIAQAVTPQSFGNQNMVNLLCAFPNLPNPVRNTAFFHEAMQFEPQALGWYWEKLGVDIEGSDTLFRWVTLPSTKDDYLFTDPKPPHWILPKFEVIERDCLEAARPYIDFQRYKGVNFIFGGNIGCCFWGGRGIQVTGSDNISRTYGYTLSDGTNWAWLGMMKHETGHSLKTKNGENLGLAHASSSIADPPGPGNIVDMMSKPGFGCPNDPKWQCLGQGTTMPQLKRLDSNLADQRALVYENEFGTKRFSLDYLYETMETNAVEVRISRNFSVFIEAHRGCQDTPDKGLCGLIDGVAVIDTDEAQKTRGRNFQDLLQAWNDRGPDFRNFIGHKGDKVTVRGITVEVVDTTAKGYLVDITRPQPGTISLELNGTQLSAAGQNLLAPYGLPTNPTAVVKVDNGQPLSVTLTLQQSTPTPRWTGFLPTKPGKHRYNITTEILGARVGIEKVLDIKTVFVPLIKR